MKKNILCVVSLLLVFSFLFGFAACNKGDDTGATSHVYAKVTKPDGSEEEVELVTNKDGEVETFTNAAGETQVAYVDADSKETVLVNKDTVTTVVEAITTKKNNKKTTTTSSTAGTTGELIDSIPTTMINNGTMPSDNASTVDVSLNSSGEPIKNGVEKKYQDIIDSGKYTIYSVMQVTTSEGTTSFPIIMAVDGKKLYVEAKPPETEGINMTLKFISDGSKCYVLVPQMLSYYEIPAEDLADLLPTQAELDAAEGTYVSTTKVSYGGKTYMCETYDTDTGLVKYYYYNDDLKRIETIGDDGTVSIMDITYISQQVSSSLFTIPKNYIKLDDFGA